MRAIPVSILILIAVLALVFVPITILVHVLISIAILVHVPISIAVSVLVQTLVSLAFGKTLLFHGACAIQVCRSLAKTAGHARFTMTSAVCAAMAAAAAAIATFTSTSASASAVTSGKLHVRRAWIAPLRESRDRPENHHESSQQPDCKTFIEKNLFHDVPPSFDH
ncbi:MAG: hypothetical protein P8Y84_13385 [Desulfuromonadales bacterium]